MNLQQPFRRATLKLATIFTAILTVICLGFSSAVYFASAPGFRREPPRLFMNFERREEIEKLVKERDQIVQADITVKLIVINILVITSGAVASYFLARWSLRPIHDNLKRQLLFVSSASHELKTPLAAIQMENEVLIRDKTVTKSDLLNQVKSNLEEIVKLKGLTDQLLRLATNETLILNDVKIEEVVKTAVSQIQSLAQQKNIKIETDLKPTIWSINQTALIEIVTILLDNAIKYSPPKSVVTIRLKNDCLEVDDTGNGIDPQDLPHIFERFYRADKARTSEGYGLGLALAQDLASKMNLKITAKNNPEKGAVFTVKPTK